MRKIYVSGPISGTVARNLEVFQGAKNYLVTLPDVESVAIPHDVAPWSHGAGTPCPPGYRSEGADHAAACHLRADLLHMLGSCNEVWMLPGWEASVGARLEMQVAAACGMPIFFLKHELIKRWQEVQPIVHQAYEALKEEGWLGFLRDQTRDSLPEDPIVRPERGFHQ